MGGFGAEVDLGVVGVAVEVHVEFANDVAEWRQVAGEEQGTQDRALRNSLRDGGEGGGGAGEGDELITVSEVGGEPVDGSALNTKLAEPVDED